VKKLWVFGAVIIFGFFIGMFVWKVKNTGKTNYVIAKISNVFSFSSDVLAEVGKEFILSEDLDFEWRILNKSSQSIGEYSKSSVYKGILHSIVERKVLYKFLIKDETFDFHQKDRLKICTELSKRARKNLSDFSPKEYQKLQDKMCEQSLIEQYCNERVYSKVDPKEEDLYIYYRDNANKFVSPEKVSLRQIVLSDEKKSKRIYEHVSANNFSQMAQTYSLGVEAKKGGILTPFARGDMPPIFDTAFTLPIGEAKGIFKSDYGWHIFIVDRRIPAGKSSFDEVRGRIRDLIIKEQRTKELQNWIEMAVRSIPVRFMKSF
jgi:hypothetical protein